MSRIALNTGLRALLSAQFALGTVGQNIANANTPGYSRQRVDLGAARPLPHRGHLLGNGVDVLGVTRTIDHLLERRILDQVQIGGSLTAQLGAAQEIEGLFGEPGGMGLGGALDGFFGKLNQLSGNPADPILRTATAQGGVDLAGRFNQLERSLTNLQSEVGRELGILTQQVNQIAYGIARLNGEIGQAESAGLQPNDLRDQRQQLLKQLSGLVDVQAQEDSSGAVRVLVSGNVLVNRETTRAMSVATDASGQPRLRIQGVDGFVTVRGGRIGGLLALRERFAPDLLKRIDGIAKNLVLAMNRVHSQGVPAGGPFQSLLGTNPIRDIDLDGELRDELVANAGLPFPVTAGSFWVNVVDRASGAVSKHPISIAPAKTTVGAVLDELNAIPNLSASLDAFGRMQIVADAGFGFDFSNRVDPTPGSKGTFGGGQASLGGSVAGPFALVPGDTLEIAVPAGSASTVTVAFDAAQFPNVNKATASQIASVLNSDGAFQAAGLVAQSVDGRLFVQTSGAGPGESFSIEGGSAVAKLGFSANVGSPVTGSLGSVAPAVSGSYKGAKTGQLVFVPTGDGVIGTTPGLGVHVLDADGQIVKTLLVGADYQPGTALDLGDGLSVTFNLGSLSASDGDRMVLDVVADSDTSDILVALGMNALFTGHDAATIGLRRDIELDPGMLAASTSGAEGDNSILLALLGVEELRLDTLGNATIGESYGALIGDVGFHVAALADGAVASGRVLDSLELRRESISGVNVDEELVDMVRFEQAFAGASQLLRVLNQLHDELLRIL